MTNSTPPQQRRRREEELIAVIVALLTFGAIFFWALRGRSGLELANWSDWLTRAGVATAPVATPTPQASPSPSPTASPADDRTPQAIAPPESPPPRPDPQLQPDARVGALPLVLPTTRATTPPTAESPAPTIAASPIDFADVPESYWARPYINYLSAAGVISGFPDQTFKPDRAVTRAEFASQIQQAFEQPDTQAPKNFKDIKPDYWAAPAINKAVSIDFMNGYPEGDFRPNKLVPRLEVLVALAKGLKLPTPENPEAILQTYQDNARIPRWARSSIAAATQAGLVTSYPNKNRLNPGEAATRADVASMIYQSLVFQKQAEPIPSNYQVSSP